MKKYFILSMIAVTAMLCGCQKANNPAAAITGEKDITINAGIDGTKTAFAPEGRKVLWLSGDQLGLKYKRTEETASKYDNVTLKLISGAGTDKAAFSGKLGTTNATPADGNFVLYYPTISNAKSTAIDDVDNFVLAASFPKIQNTGDVLFDANLMYGIVKGIEGWPTTTDAPIAADVTMKNVMSVLDFIVSGTGSLKRIYVTDLNESAQKMFGDENVTIVNGLVTGIALGASASVSDRTIIAEFNKPIELTQSGSHAYVTVLPRAYTSGIKVCFELTSGDYMVATISTPFTLASNTVYPVPAIGFSSTAATCKGYYDGVEYSYQTITDSRDQNVYRVATLSDGRTWMLDNLRYLPEGYTPSNSLQEPDNGVWFPAVMNATGTGVQFGTAADVAKFGYLYNYSVALGKDAEYVKDWYDVIAAIEDAEESLEKSNQMAQELAALAGTQGVCPAGWHVPTLAEYNALYKAPCNSISGLGTQGFLFNDFGCLVVAKTATAATLNGYANNKMNMSYLILSTHKNINFYNCPIVNQNNGTAAVSQAAPRSAGVVRCIMDLPDPE